MNTAMEALHRAVNRAIQSGSPAIVERKPQSVTITVKHVDGVDYVDATFHYEEWVHMAPIKRVLSIHEQCRAVLNGGRFEVIRETLNA